MVAHWDLPTDFDLEKSSAVKKAEKKDSKKARLWEAKSDLLLAQTMVVPKVVHLAAMKASMSEIQKVSNSVDKTDSRKECSKDKALADQTARNWAHSSEK